MHIDVLSIGRRMILKMRKTLVLNRAARSFRRIVSVPDSESAGSMVFFDIN